MRNPEGIIESAKALFDAVGVSRISEGKYLLILGLESTPDRDLDEFGREQSKFRMYGFEKYVARRLEQLIRFIGSKGYQASLVGQMGYPLKGEINLKTLAIKAGMGKRGKSSVLLHTDFGPRLRLMALETDAPLESFTRDELPDSASPFCEKCSICIDDCPVGVLVEYRMKDGEGCLSNITPLDSQGRSVLCDICLKRCPAGSRIFPPGLAEPV